MRVVEKSEDDTGADHTETDHAVRPLRRRNTLPMPANKGPGMWHPRLWSSLRAGLAVAGLLVTPAAVVWLTTQPWSTNASPQSAVSATSSPSAGVFDMPWGPSCVPLTVPGQPVVDTDSDGCAEPVRVSAGRIEVRAGGEPVLYELGEPDDQILIGDWNCNGRATPLLYRPGTGAVFRYDDWPSDTRPVRPVPSTAVPGGHAVRRHQQGCDTVRVLPELP